MQVEAQYTYKQYAQCIFSFESDHKLQTAAAPDDGQCVAQNMLSFI